MICENCSFGRSQEICLSGVSTQLEKSMVDLSGDFRLVGYERVADALLEMFSKNKGLVPVVSKDYFLSKERIPKYSNNQIIVNFPDVTELICDDYREYQRRLSGMYQIVLMELGFIEKGDGLLIGNPRLRDVRKLYNLTRFDLPHPNCPVMADIRWDEQYISSLAFRHSPEALIIPTQPQGKVF